MRSQGFLKDQKELLSNLTKNKKYIHWKGLVNELMFRFASHNYILNHTAGLPENFRGFEVAMRKIFCALRIQINYVTLLSYEGQLGNKLDATKLQSSLKTMTSGIAKNIYKFYTLDKKLREAKHPLNPDLLADQNLRSKDRVYFYWMDCGRVTAQDVYEWSQMKLSSKISDKPVASLIKLHMAKNLFSDF
jgi:hypothetical protein